MGPSPLSRPRPSHPRPRRRGSQGAWVLQPLPRHREAPLPRGGGQGLLRQGPRGQGLSRHDYDFPGRHGRPDQPRRLLVAQGGHQTQHDRPRPLGLDGRLRGVSPARRRPLQRGRRRIGSQHLARQVGAPQPRGDRGSGQTRGDHVLHPRRSLGHPPLFHDDVERGQPSRFFDRLRPAVHHPGYAVSLLVRLRPVSLGRGRLHFAHEYASQQRGLSALVRDERLLPPHAGPRRAQPRHQRAVRS